MSSFGRKKLLQFHVSVANCESFIHKCNPELVPDTVTSQNAHCNSYSLLSTDDSLVCLFPVH